MGKIIVVNKSRKEFQCSKCHGTIPIGSMYIKGMLNFRPAIVRCMNCRIEHWEVTTSEYVSKVGEIKYRWQDMYGVSESSVEEMVSQLEEIRNELDDKLSNMPDSLKDSPTGVLLEERIEQIEETTSRLEDIDAEMLKEEVLQEFIDGMEEELSEFEDEELTYDDIVGCDTDKWENISPGISEDLSDEYNTKLAEEIEAALESIEI